MNPTSICNVDACSDLDIPFLTFEQIDSTKTAAALILRCGWNYITHMQ